MTLFSPVALFWLASLPIFIWLWRLAATRRKIRVPSLAPFEHLIRRSARTRTRLVVNTLFWLQLAALLLLILALAGPLLLHRRAKTILVVLDTSASMGAVHRGVVLLNLAKQQLTRRLSRKHPADSVFIVTSAPVDALMDQPQAELSVIRRALDRARVNHLAGNLATAAHIGGALLGGHVDQTIVVTDEVAPLVLDEGVEFLSVHEPISNLALVGFDARGGLCRDDAPRLVVMAQNFSTDPVAVRVTVRQGRRLVAETDGHLEPGARRQLSLALPEDLDGWVEVHLESAQDALAVDNHIDVLVRRSSMLPVAVVSDNPAFADVVSGWLTACQGLVWTDDASTIAGQPHVIISDRDVSGGLHTAGILRWSVPAQRRDVTLAYWLVDADHPVGSYLGPVEAVAASFDGSVGLGLLGEPVVWGLVNGQRVPLVVAADHHGRRHVTVLIDPTGSPDSIPLLTIVLNSLRWLMGSSESVRTGEPLSISLLGRGRVTIRRPDGRVEYRVHQGGVFQYPSTAQVGLYRIEQGTMRLQRAANFLDPLESDLLTPTSTWQSIARDEAYSLEEPIVRRPLAPMLATLILLLLLGEWVLYSRKKR